MLSALLLPVPLQTGNQGAMSCVFDHFLKACQLSYAPSAWCA
jgi:hypothetical protein